MKAIAAKTAHTVKINKAARRTIVPRMASCVQKDVSRRKTSHLILARPTAVQQKSQSAAVSRLLQLLNVAREGRSVKGNNTPTHMPVVIPLQTLH